MAKNFDISIDTQKFNKGLESYLKKYEKKEVHKGLKKVAFALLAMIIKKNPVDTGRSRAGWYPAAEKLGLPTSGSSKKEGSYKEDFKGKNQSITIANRVNYTTYLEFGHSKQAPEGMVRVSMREMTKKIKDKF